MAKAQSIARVEDSFLKRSIEGSSPPGVFVGRVGYPKVSIGPMVPPRYGDTSLLDTPEEWLGKPVEEIVEYRYSLVRGNTGANVTDACDPPRLLINLQELAMADRPVDTELTLTKPPHRVITFSEETQPFGPSAPLERFRIGNAHADRRIERAYYDRSLKAKEAVWEMYSNGVYLTRIQKALSLGMFGEGSKRRIVPTRWSITAVDSALSELLLSEVKRNPTIEEYRVYSFDVYDNRYVAILMPQQFRFEWIEAWFPNTRWNHSNNSQFMTGDHEGYFGRKTYARVGGCYYSTRFAVAEALRKEGRQAAAIVLREVYPGYTIPLGVWNVRESIRELMRQEHERHETFNSALDSAMKKLVITRENWIKKSVLISGESTQTKIGEFLDSW